MLEVTAGQCVAETAFAYGLRNTGEFTVDGRSLADAARSEPEIMRVPATTIIGTMTETYLCKHSRVCPTLIRRF